MAKIFYHYVRLTGIILLLLLFFSKMPFHCFAETDWKTQLSEQEIQSIYARCWQLLSRIHIDKKGLNKAIELYKQVLEAAPHNRDIHWKLSECTFKKAEAAGDGENILKIYKEALNYAKTTKKAFKDSIEAHFWIGCCSARIAEIVNGITALPTINEAKTELRMTIELNPDHRFAILAGAILAAIDADTPGPLRDLKKAEQYAMEAVQKDPNLTLASLTLSKILLQKKKITRARKELVRCLNIRKPTYVWDAQLYNWPKARQILSEIDNNQ